MKKLILLTGFIFALSQADYAQVCPPSVRGSVGIGSAPNRLILYLRPTVTIANAVFSTLQFNVAIPSTIVTPPALVFVSTPFAGVTWIIDPPYIEGGYWNYNIYNAAAGYTLNVTAGVEFSALELQFNGPISVPATNSAFSTCLPDGGNVTGIGYFFCSGSINSCGQDLFYPRPGTTVFNGDSYFQLLDPGNPNGTSGTQISYARLDDAIVLPVNWLSFDAVKKGNDALLNWKVANEDLNHHFEVLRSNDGVNFTSIATINKSGINNGVYNYTDAGINSLRASVLYYRIRQVDLNGKTGYSDIKNISLSGKSFEVKIYPNPVIKGFYVDMNLPDVNQQDKINLKLVASNGQFITSKEITALQSANYYFDISDKQLASGQYNLQIIIKDKIVATKMLTINQ